MSRINSTIQGPQNVPDGRIDGRGLTFNAPLAAIGQSFESLGALGNQMANHYKSIHDANVARKASVEFDLRLGEAQSALDEAVDPESFNRVLAEQSEALTSLADEMVSRVDGPQLQEKMMAQMNLASGRFAIQARRKLFEREESEFRLGVSNDVEAMKESGDWEGAIALVEERGPVAWAPQEVRAMVDQLQHERDVTLAESAIQSYMEGGEAPTLDSFEHLAPDDRIRLRRQLVSARASRGGGVSATALRPVVDDLVGQRVPLDEGLAAVRARMVESGLSGHDLEDAISAVEDDYMVAEIGREFSLARRAGTLEAYNAAIAFAQQDRFEASPQALEASARVVEYLRNGINTLSSGDQSDRSFERMAALRIPDAMAGLMSQISYGEDGSVQAPGEAAFRQAMEEATGLSGLQLPQESADGRLISEGDISLAALHDVQAQISEAWEAYRKSVLSSAPPPLSDLAVSPMSNSDPAFRARVIDAHWASSGFSFSGGGEVDANRMQLLVDAMNTQRAIPAEIASGLMGGLSGTEENAAFHEGMGLLRREGLAASAFASFRRQGMSSEAAYQDFIQLNDLFLEAAETGKSATESLAHARNAVDSRTDLDAADEFLSNHAPGAVPVFDQVLEHRGYDILDEEGGVLDGEDLLSSVAARFLEDQLGDGEADNASRFAARSMAAAWLDALQAEAEGMPMRSLDAKELREVVAVADAAVSDLGYAPTLYASAGGEMALARQAPEAMYGVVGREGGLTAIDAAIFGGVALSNSESSRSSYIGEQSLRHLLSSVGDPQVVSSIGPMLGPEAERAYRRVLDFYSQPTSSLSSGDALAREAIFQLNLFEARNSSGPALDGREGVSDALSGFSTKGLGSAYQSIGALIMAVGKVSEHIVLTPEAELAEPDPAAARRIARAEASNLPRSIEAPQVQYRVELIGPSGDPLPYFVGGAQPYYERSLLYYQDLIARELHERSKSLRHAGAVGIMAGPAGGIQGFVRMVSGDEPGESAPNEPPSLPAPSE